jgi:hypothetical protein
VTDDPETAVEIIGPCYARLPRGGPAGSPAPQGILRTSGWRSSSRMICYPRLGDVSSEPRECLSASPTQIFRLLWTRWL